MTNLILSGLLATLAAVGTGDSSSKNRPAAQAQRAALLCKQLQCTPAQQQKIKEIRKNVRSELSDEKAELVNLRRSLAAEFAKTNLDKAAIGRITNRMQALRNEIAQERTSSMIETHAVLTAEQRKKYSEILARRGHERHGKRKAKHAANGGPKGKGAGKGKGSPAKGKTKPAGKGGKPAR
jgi:Spy/CpxP family protein refolding chaperone